MLTNHKALTVGISKQRESKVERFTDRFLTAYFSLQKRSKRKEKQARKEKKAVKCLYEVKYIGLLIFFRSCLRTVTSRKLSM